MQVDFYYAIDSRYSYLAATQVPALEREFGCTIGWKPLSFQALMDSIVFKLVKEGAVA